MSQTTFNRNLRCCALCRYWNGALGSTTIQILPGGNTFRFEATEKHSCFKSGRGMEMTAVQLCPFFVPRYEQ